jgi:hypothetical protein
VSALSSNRAALFELHDFWLELAASRSCSPEVDYRLRKMSRRLAHMADMMFIKTVKAQEMLLQCREFSQRLSDLLDTVEQEQGRDLYRVLTGLEVLFEELLIKTYEFRVKAG